MSLLSRDQVRIVMCADRLIAVRLARGIRRRVLSKEIFPVPGPGVDWQPALPVLSQLLKQPAWQNADTSVILSSRFMRYQLMPAAQAVLSEAERLALARHVYSRTYGESAASLALRVSGGHFGAGSVVCGVEQELLAGLRQAVEASSAKLVSIQPCLMSAFNGWRAALGRQTQWFALVESGVLCTALLHQGQWKSLRVKRISEDWLGELQLALRRERIADGLAEKTVKVSVCLDDDREIELPAGEKASFDRLRLPSAPGFSPLTDGRYAMALAGAL